jgi:adenine-specific DNA methylase
MPGGAGPGLSAFAYSNAASAQQQSYQGLSDFGIWTSMAGAALSAVGNYYAVKSQQAALESQALSMEHQATMSAINARAAEMDAQAIIEAGNREQSQVSAQYGQIKAGERAATAGRGIQAGVGSAAEVQASIEYAKQADVYQVNSNAVRAAAAARAQSVNATNESNLARVSAANLRGTASSLNPYLAAGTSLLSSASGISQQWLARNRYSNKARF